MTVAPSLLVLPATLHERITAHARAEMPREAIGVVGGTGGGVARDVVALANLVSGTRGFLADPYDQFCALRQFTAQGLELLAIYHSHPHGALELSSLDAEYGRRWACAHIVVAVGRPDVPDGECRAFRFSDAGAACAVEVVIAGD